MRLGRTVVTVLIIVFGVLLAQAWNMLIGIFNPPLHQVQFWELIGLILMASFVAIALRAVDGRK